MNVERGFGLPCPGCGHLYSRTVEVRGDVLDERQARRIRVLECRSCSSTFESVEVVVPAARRVRLPDPRRRLVLVRAARYEQTGS